MTARIIFPDQVFDNVNQANDLEVAFVDPSLAITTANYFTGSPGQFQDNWSFPLYFTHLGGLGSKVVFELTDNTHGRELWISDGTFAGTSLLKDINTVSPTATNDGFPDRSNFSPSSLFNSFSKALTGNVFFAATDGTHGVELWKTNGTALGTVMVKDINTTSVNAASNPVGFTIFNNQMFFTANDGVHGTQLWKSDGTALGTVAVTNLTNFFPFGFVVSGTLMYFSADDGLHGSELWETDGTAAGTLMVKNINTRSFPTPPQLDFGSSPTALTAGANAILYFSADDGTHGSELWRSDGSAQGTFMVKNIDTNFQQGNTEEDGSNIQQMVYSPTLNLLLFGADDGVHGNELWKSDGTTNGTVLVKDINPVESFQGTTGSNIFNMLVVGGEVFFTATNGINGVELWKSDGTTGGTTMVANVNTHGDSTPQLFQQVGGSLYYVANDGATGQQNSQYSIYRTDGFYNQLVASHIYNVGNGFNIFGVIFTPPPVGDFNADGPTDVLFHNNGNGDTGFWQINGNVITAFRDFGMMNTAYSTVGQGDFNGDGVSDVLFRNGTNGDIGFWQINGNVVTAFRDLGTSDTSYSVVGAGDFNGDGVSDVLFRNVGGDVGYWSIVNNGVSSFHDFGMSSTAYSVVGVGDFNADGISDVLFQNASSGDVGFWQINNSAVTGFRDIGVASAGYAVVGVGDFNGDGIPDILLHNNATGDTGFWQIQNSMAFGFHDIGSSNSSYTVAAVGDYNADGTSDILFRNATTGDIGFWQINNGNLNGFHDFGSASTSYNVVPN